MLLYIIYIFLKCVCRKIIFSVTLKTVKGLYKNMYFRIGHYFQNFDSVPVVLHVLGHQWLLYSWWKLQMKTLCGRLITGSRDRVCPSFLSGDRPPMCSSSMRDNISETLLHLAATTGWSSRHKNVSTRHACTSCVASVRVPSTILELERGCGSFSLGNEPLWGQNCLTSMGQLTVYL